MQQRGAAHRPHLRLPERSPLPSPVHIANAGSLFFCARQVMPKSSVSTMKDIWRPPPTPRSTAASSSLCASTASCTRRINKKWPLARGNNGMQQAEQRQVQGMEGDHQVRGARHPPPTLRTPTYLQEAQHAALLVHLVGRRDLRAKKRAREGGRGGTG